jgi:hypothetical protein
VFVIEVNDNLKVDRAVEHAVLRDDLYCRSGLNGLCFAPSG